MDEEERIAIKFELRSGDRSIEAETAIPKAPMRVADLLPVLHAFDDAVVGMAADSLESAGGKISCRPGCGACCRQLVPIGEAEAHYLAELVASLPAEQRERVWARFAEAHRALGPAMLDRLRDKSRLRDVEARRAIGIEYFQLGVACPFLEDESCSIHPYRPMSCREYLVTNPAENCSRPGPDNIEMVCLPQKLSEVLYCFGDGRGYERSRWVPLVLALEWAEKNATQPQRMFPGAEMFKNFVTRTAGK